jgi:hypothetical protein
MSQFDITEINESEGLVLITSFSIFIHNFDLYQSNKIVSYMEIIEV